MLRVEPALVTDRVGGAVAGRARRAAEVLAAAGLPGARAAYAVAPWTAAASSAACPPIGDGGAAVFDLVVPRADVDGRSAGPAGRAARPGVAAYEALRVEARRPRFGVDSDHRTIPNELQWLQTAVHLDKGCYRGQETVARVHNLGRPPRRLVLLHLDGVSEVLAEPGTPVLAGTREVGRVGTVVRHHELGVIALALVKQSVRDGRGADGRRVDGRRSTRTTPRPTPTTPWPRPVSGCRAVRSATIGR